MLGGRADATQPVSPSPTQPSPPPISTTPASSSYGREGKEIFSDGREFESDDEDAEDPLSPLRLSTTSPTSSLFCVSSSSASKSGFTPLGDASTGVASASRSQASAEPNNRGPDATRAEEESPLAELPPYGDSVLEYASFEKSPPTPFCCEKSRGLLTYPAKPNTGREVWPRSRVLLMIKPRTGK